MPIINSQAFIANYWQKKPCVIRNFIPNFSDPIDEHELAGLAQLEEIDARLMSQKNGSWTVTQGPIDDFEPLCVNDWTLLVQGVDRYIDDIDALFRHVDFLPTWRTDDVMVSYSVKNAGVGAHIDEYDVFIVQGKGKRQWQVGLPGTFETDIPHPLLRLIKGFTPIIDVELSSGDAIYIPPFHPHSGITIEDSLNYSLGFRAPNTIELLSGLADECIANEKDDGKNASISSTFRLSHLLNTRYSDPDIHKKRHNNPQGEVSFEEIDALKSHLKTLIDAKEATPMLMRFLSLQALPSEEVVELSVIELEQLLVLGNAIRKTSGVKPIYLQKDKEEKEDFNFYIDGHSFQVDASVGSLFGELFETSMLVISKDDIHLIHNNQEAKQTLLQLINLGFYYIDNE